MANTAQQAGNGMKPAGLPVTLEVVGWLNQAWLSMLGQSPRAGHAGLRYASHQWDHLPYWHLWIEGAPGVYRLEIRGVRQGPGWPWVADLGIRYFPALNEPSFSRLSIIEQLYRQSDIFTGAPAAGPSGCVCQGGGEHHHPQRFADLGGQVGAPSSGDSHGLPPDLFHVGDLVLAQAEPGWLFRLKTQSEWRVTLEADLETSGQDGRRLLLRRKGEMDRRLPGWDICRGFFHVLVQGWMAWRRMPALRQSLLRGPGLAFLTDGTVLRAQASEEVSAMVAQATLGDCPLAKKLDPEDLQWLREESF